MALLYGCAGRLNTKNAGFRPGQAPETQILPLGLAEAAPISSASSLPVAMLHEQALLAAWCTPGDDAEVLAVTGDYDGVHFNQTGAVKLFSQAEGYRTLLMVDNRTDRPALVQLDCRRSVGCEVRFNTDAAQFTTDLSAELRAELALDAKVILTPPCIFHR